MRTSCRRLLGIIIAIHVHVITLSEGYRHQDPADFNHAVKVEKTPNHSGEGEQRKHGWSSYEDQLSSPRALLTGALVLTLSVVGVILLAAFGKHGDDECPQQERVSSSRSARLDNAKFFFVAMVVLPHFSGAPSWPLPRRECFSPNSGMLAVGDWTAFNTRGLCFISGLLSRKAASSQSLANLFYRIVVPVILVSLLLKPADVFMRQKFTSGRIMTLPELIEVMMHALLGIQHPWQQHGLIGYWYLHALIFWRLWGFMLHPVKNSIVRVVFALKLAILGYYLECHVFHLSMAMVFFPIFVVGQLWPMTSTLEMLHGWKKLPVLAAASVLLAATLVTRRSSWMLWIDSADMSCSASENLFVAAVALFLANIFELGKALVIIFLVCSGEPSLISEAGKHSLYIYLLHGPPVWGFMCLLQRFGLCPYIISASMTRQFLAWMILTFASVSISFLLASWPVRSLFSTIIEPLWFENFCKSCTDAKNSVGSETKRWQQEKGDTDKARAATVQQED